MQAADSIHPDRADTGSPDQRISVVIPTLNERADLPSTIASIGADAATEIVVSDGGSRDGTMDLAARIAHRVVMGPRGRAEQLNAGAAIASGDILVFLHADTRLPAKAIESIRSSLRQPGVVGGAFRFAIDSTRASLQLIAFGANLRSRILKLPLGDQALFVRREIFEGLGGFRDLQIMEDMDFVKRLRRQGQLALLDMPALTSDRRWQVNGVVRTTCVNLAAVTMYALAISPRRIRAFYDSHLDARPPLAPAGDD